MYNDKAGDVIEVMNTADIGWGPLTLGMYNAKASYTTKTILRYKKEVYLNTLVGMVNAV